MDRTRTHNGVPGHDSAPTRLRALRIAITAFFALDGFVFAGWVVRIPAIKEQTGASPGALGLALLGVSAGAVITMMLTGRLCRRFGSHPVTVACAVLLSLGVALPPLTHSALALGAVLLVFGAAFGGINVAFNSAAVDLVAALGRPVMPSFHAAFSLGGMLGAGLGSLVAGPLSPNGSLCPPRSQASRYSPRSPPASRSPPVTRPPNDHSPLSRDTSRCRKSALREHEATIQSFDSYNSLEALRPGRTEGGRSVTIRFSGWSRTRRNDATVRAQLRSRR